MRKYITILLIFIIAIVGCAKKKTEDVTTIKPVDIMKIVTAGKINAQLEKANVGVNKARTVLKERYGINNKKIYDIIKKAYPNTKATMVTSYTYKEALKPVNSESIILRFNVQVAPVNLNKTYTIDFVFDKDRNLISIYVME